MLKKAIKNSQRKKYHGEFETLHQLPNSQEQFSRVLSKAPSYKKYFEITKKEKEGKNETYEIKEK